MITNLQTTLDECVERFEDAWDSEDTPSVEDFFPPRDSKEFAEVAIELLRIDMERRWAGSDLKLLREYRAEFSWLVERPDLLSQLAFEEYRLRSLRGEPVRGILRDGIQCRHFRLASLIACRAGYQRPAAVE